jgi:cysteinyl-tRNA synthetase
MSKSEGNFVTINELLETDKFGGRKWPGEVLRLAMLMTHYRQPIDFSVKRLEEAQALIRKWSDLAEAIRNKPGQAAEVLGAEFAVPDSMMDDLNLWPVVSSLTNLGESGAAGSAADASSFLTTLSLLGFDDVHMFSQAIANYDPYIGLSISIKEITAAIDERLSLLKEKRFTEADKIRDELLAKGIQLKDGKEPVTGERITEFEVKR